MDLRRFSAVTVTLFSTMTINDIVKQLDEQIRQLQDARRVLTESIDSSSQPSTPQGRRGPRSMSREARDRIAAAQRARWAKRKGQSTTGSAQSSTNGPSTPAARTSTRRLSAAARARIAAAQKARWARVRAQKKK